MSSNKQAQDRMSLPQEVRENTARTSERKIGDWMDEAFKDFQQDEGLAHNPFKGKPLPVDDAHFAENYAIHSMMKNANIKPPWLELQHKIRDQIKAVLDLIEQNPEAHVDDEIATINEQIKKYNNSCPSPLLQKTRIFRDRIGTQVKSWG